jgi:hypothetical protein
MLVFSTQLCEMLPLFTPSLWKTLPPLLPSLCNFGYSYTVHTLRIYNERKCFLCKITFRKFYNFYFLTVSGYTLFVLIRNLHDMKTVQTALMLFSTK